MDDSPYKIGRGLTGLPKPAALGIVTAAYLLAGLVGWLVLPDLHPLAAFFVADLAATVVVWAVSMLVANASLYDPYWSVAPPVIIAGWLAVAGGQLNLRQAVVLVLVLAWAIRLTGNWAVGWPGFGHEDWRYVQMREDTRGRLPWGLVNFVGIQLVPTLIVFVGLLGVWPAVVGNREVNLVDLLAVIVTGLAIAIEAVSDIQLHRFTGDPANRGKVVDIGLWRRSRHPNYLGEITFWWGLWLFGLAAAPGWWWTIIGPLAMVGLFLGVSIPLMEKRSLRRRPEYAGYQRRVPVLLPSLRRNP